MSLIMYDQFMMYSPDFIKWDNCPFRMNYNIYSGLSFMFYDDVEYWVLAASYRECYSFTSEGVKDLKNKRNYNTIYQL